MIRSGGAAQLQEDPWEQLQDHLSYVDHQDNFPVVITANQAA